MRPGSGGEDYALAYETQVGATSKFEVRWESVGAGTSVPSAAYTTAQIPVDFAVALDSAGNTMVLWREQQGPSLGAASDLWLVGFDPSHNEIYPPTKLETDIFADDTVSTTTTIYNHNYRPFAIASQANKRFVIVFGRRSGVQARIYARSLTLDSLGAGSHDLSAPLDLTPPGDAAPFYYMGSVARLLVQTRLHQLFPALQRQHLHEVRAGVFHLRPRGHGLRGRKRLFRGPDQRALVPVPLFQMRQRGHGREGRPGGGLR
jgi:hypothetical protein